MLQYLAQFMIYTLAMTGVLVIGYVVYKKMSVSSNLRKNRQIEILDILRLPDRKTLYLIGCKNEQFLIASSNDKVTLISKIGEKTETRRNNAQMIEKYLAEKEENVFFETPPVKTSQISAEGDEKKYFIKNLLKELSDKNQTRRGNY